jgi:S1-C subfamily serine protease
MKPFLRTWVVLLLGAILFVVGLFWVRANYAELQKKDPLTESQDRIEDTFGMRVAKESGSAGGLLVEVVDPESVAGRAGIQAGDRIVALGDRSLWHVYQFAELINSAAEVAPVLALLVARDGEYRSVLIGYRGGPLEMPQTSHSGHTH